MKSVVRSKELTSKSAAVFASRKHSLFVQPKLFVSQPNDRFEQEANRVADGIAIGEKNNFIQYKQNGQLPETKFNPGFFPVSTTPGLQTKTDTRENEGDYVDDAVFSSQQSGKNLDQATVSFMSSCFGADLSKVKIHNDSEAASLSTHLNAQAFTVGNNIYFNEGKYAPHTSQGQHLLAHELTHTVQQGGAPLAIQKEEKKESTYAPKPEIDFKILPPDLQLRLFHFLLQADTSKVHLDYETRGFMAGLSYSYGDALSLKMRFTDFTTKLGWKPGDNTFSLGVSGGGFKAGITASPFQSKYGLNLSYGAPLLPMFDPMSKNFSAGGTSIGNMMAGLPGLTSDPLAWYQQYKPDIENISKSADLVKDITKAGKSKIKFGAGFSLTYDPVNELVIGGRAGIMF